MTSTSHRIVKSTCCYCGTGCGVLIETDGERVIGVTGDPDHPANFGRLCSKGASLHLTDMRVGRALYPELRVERSQPRQQVSWDEALDAAADQFARIIYDHGPQAVAFYLSGQLLTEDYYVFNKLARALIGTNHVDSNSRLCMSSAVAGYKATLGSDTVPCSYNDLENTDCLLIAGANPAFAHPVLFRRIEAAKAARPDMKIIVIDPRRTDSAELADLHLAILPGTDVALLHAMLNIMVWEGWLDETYIAAHTDGFSELKRSIREYSPRFAAEICGITAEEIYTAARWFAQSPRSLSLWCMGLNQSSHGVDKNAALIHLHLATGKIGKPGCGPFSLTGQPNAMGGREVGAMANLLSGHRDIHNPQHQAEVAAIWGVDSLPIHTGKTAVEMFQALEQGDIKAVWIVCSNPLHSLPDAAQARRALAKAEFVVVQEAYAHTDTTPFADLLLPASSWAEKEGTVTNSERRISRVQQAVAAPGEARHDWQIAVDFAQRLDVRIRRRSGFSPTSNVGLKPDLSRRVVGPKPDLSRRIVGLKPDLHYSSPEAIFNEHRQLSLGRDLDIGGLSYPLLETQGPQQWPYRQGAQQGPTHLYSDGLFATPSGRAQFIALDYLPVAEKTDARYPLHLNTGRLRDQWHGMSRTGTAAQLFGHVGEPLLGVNPEDLKRFALNSGDLAKVKSRRGELILKVEADPSLARGQVFLPMHWSGRFMAGLGVNALTLPRLDPVSKQPELKHAAVRLEKVELAWQMVAIKRSEDAIALLHRAADLLAQFDYGSCSLFGREQAAVVLKLGHHHAPASSFLDELDALFGFTDPMATLSYQDARKGIAKRAEIRQGKLVGIRLCGETLAQDWLRDLIEAGADAAPLRPWLLAPRAAPPNGHTASAKVVCNCLGIRLNQIEEAIANGCNLTGLQEGLGCGSQCGSCVPELKRLLTGVTQPS